MNMTDIAYFLKVIECGSFSKASEEMYVSQQAVSLHIKHLEDTYKVQLFERRPALKLTHAGQLLREAAEEIIQSETVLMDQLSVSREDFTGELTIGMPANRSAAFASEFIPQFSSLYPNMSASLVEQHSSSLPAELLRNKIDLALPLISHTAFPLDQTYLEIFPLNQETLYVVISDTLLKKAFPDRFPACKVDFRSGISLYQIAHLPMFLYPTNGHLHHEIIDTIKSRGISPFIRVKTSLTNSLVDLCVKGYGVYFSPTMMVKYTCQTQPGAFQKLNAFPVLEYLGVRQTYLVYHRKKVLTKPLLDSIRIIKEIYSEHNRFDQYLQRP